MITGLPNSSCSRPWFCAILITCCGLVVAGFPTAGHATVLRHELSILQDAKAAGASNAERRELLPIFLQAPAQWPGDLRAYFSAFSKDSVEIGILLIGGFLALGYSYLFFTSGFLLMWVCKYFPWLLHDCQRTWGRAGILIAMLLAPVLAIPLTWRYASAAERAWLKDLLLAGPPLLAILAVAPYLYAAKTAAVIEFTLAPQQSALEFYLGFWDFSIIWPIATSPFPWSLIISAAAGLLVFWLLIWKFRAVATAGFSSFPCNLCSQLICGKCATELNGTFLCAACFATRSRPGPGNRALVRRIRRKKWLIASLAVFLPGYEAFYAGRIRESSLFLALTSCAVAMPLLPHSWLLLASRHPLQSGLLKYYAFSGIALLFYIYSWKRAQKMIPLYLWQRSAFLRNVLSQ